MVAAPIALSSASEGVDQSIGSLKETVRGIINTWRKNEIHFNGGLDTVRLQSELMLTYEDVHPK